MRARALLAALVLGAQAAAQGFAGLGGGAEGFALPDPARRFEFPADHGAHPEFRVEWWYLTANLDGADGEAYGVQWTLFRSALAPGGATGDQVWMGHLGVSTPAGHLVAERLARGGLGSAGVTAAPFSAHIDEWRLAGPDPGEAALFAQGPDFAVRLEVRADGPIVPQGDRGYSVKSPSGTASHYYSQPFYTASGSLTLPGGREVAVTGQAWLDREWSSAPLSPTQDGWDWMSLHLDDGAKLMAFRLRDSASADHVTGTWIAADGTPSPLAPGDVRLTPLEVIEVAGRDLPLRWRVEVPARDLSVRVEALRDDAWMATRPPYWEGPVTVRGTHSGQGYLELTGYPED